MMHLEFHILSEIAIALYYQSSTLHSPHWKVAFIWKLQVNELVVPPKFPL